VATTTVVVRRITSGAEAERILDALDAAIDLPSDRLSTGRRYTLSERTQGDRASAVATLSAELDKISATWASHVKIRGID
jgi:NADPH-dependent ferric siderophore reductase